MSNTSLAVGWGSGGANCSLRAGRERLQANTCPLLEVGVVLTLLASAPVCLCKPCLLTHLTPHKGRRQSHPEVLYRAASWQGGPCN